MYKLLIVDDEVHILEGMKHLIDWKSYLIGEIHTASTYAEALLVAAAVQPTIGLFDVCIGNDKGYDLIREIKALGLKTHCIVMSGYEEFDYVQESLRIGAKDYLLKPVDQKHLENAIEKIIVSDLGGSIANPPANLGDIDPVSGRLYSSLSKLGHRMIQMIQAGYPGDISLRSVADTFQMNSTYLGQIFIQEMNMKFSEYLMVYRLLIAQEKIETTDEKIATIALDVGYKNPNYFYTHFRSHFGCSPTDLRESSS